MQLSLFLVIVVIIVVVVIIILTINLRWDHKYPHTPYHNHHRQHQ